MKQMVIFHLIHVLFAVFSAGAAFYLAFFVTPALKRAGPSGSHYFRHLAHSRALSIIVVGMPTLGGVFGLLLLKINSGNFNLSFFNTNGGKMLLIGGSLGLLAWITLITIIVPAIVELRYLSLTFEKDGEKLDDYESADFTRLCRKLATGTRIITFLMIGAITFMSLWRNV